MAVREASASRPSARERLLAAANELFYNEGVHTVGIDRVIEQAGVAKASLYNTFGSKDELFVRAAAFDLEIPDLDKIKRSQVGETLIRRFLELGEGYTGMTVLLRSAASNEYAASRVRKLIAAQVVPAFARAGNRATARERAALVTSQLLGLALCRYILKISPLAEMSPEEIIKHIAPTLQRYANGTS
jgi:AcrR family transcriptional regulator